ncbi:MAG: hypothetical protein WAW96_08665, partial [Alphaproteobacteria bacterium]
MSIRLRRIGKMLVALGGANSTPQPGDRYLDDEAQAALITKFCMDWHHGDFREADYGNPPLTSVLADLYQLKHYQQAEAISKRLVARNGLRKCSWWSWLFRRDFPQYRDLPSLAMGPGGLRPLDHSAVDSAEQPNSPQSKGRGIPDMPGPIPPPPSAAENKTTEKDPPVLYRCSGCRHLGEGTRHFSPRFGWRYFVPTGWKQIFGANEHELLCDRCLRIDPV